MSKPKELRKQLRNVVQEVLPEVLTAEVILAIEKKLFERVEIIAKNVKDTLKGIDDRAKDVQAFMVRQTFSPGPTQNDASLDTKGE